MAMRQCEGLAGMSVYWGLRRWDRGTVHKINTEPVGLLYRLTGLVRVLVKEVIGTQFMNMVETCGDKRQCKKSPVSTR